MKENRMKRALQQGGLVIGTINRYFRSPEIAQVLATAGYDFIWIDMEHSCFDLETVADIIRAALAADITPLVRVPELQSHFISRVLDSGAMGVIVPQVEKKEEAEQIIQYSKYFPQGRRRTVGRIAHGNYASVNQAEFDRQSNEEIMGIALVETAKGVENIEEITSVKGLDAVIVGVGDLSLSLGISGQTDHEMVRDCVRKVNEACRRNNIYLGLGPVGGVEVAKRWIREGVRFYTHSVDIAFLMDSAAAAAKELREGMK